MKASRAYIVLNITGIVIAACSIFITSKYFFIIAGPFITRETFVMNMPLYPKSFHEMMSGPFPNVIITYPKRLRESESGEISVRFDLQRARMFGFELIHGSAKDSDKVGIGLETPDFVVSPEDVRYYTIADLKTKEIFWKWIIKPTGAGDRHIMIRFDNLPLKEIHTRELGWAKDIGRYDVKYLSDKRISYETTIDYLENPLLLSINVKTDLGISPFSNSLLHYLSLLIVAAFSVNLCLKVVIRRKN